MGTNGQKNCSHERYFQLLVLVKTNSSINFLWISFIEGLHRHAAMILALLCTKFVHNNKIQPGSLSIQDFKAAKIPHFNDPKISPDDQIKLIMNGKFKAMMFKNTFTVEVYIPKKVDENILELMDSMCKQSKWISECKKHAANKTILTVLLIWLEDTLLHSKPRKRNSIHSGPKLTSMFTYLNPDTAEKYAATIQNDNDNIYEFCPLLNCNEWTRYIRDLLNKSVRDEFVEFITPDGTTNNLKRKVKPPYAIWWPSLTTDVGPIEKRSRCIDVRHVNGYLIILGIVYLLNMKLQKYVLNDQLGENQEMNLINFIIRFGYAT